MFARSAQAAAQGGAALAIITLCFAMTGCSASYATPGRAADFKALGVSRQAMTDASINQALAKAPLAKFPCGIAAVRIQAPDYRSDSAESYGAGNYCVITNRDTEAEADVERLSKLPMVTGLAPMNRLILPHQLNSDLELRQGAASLHADILLVYTLDTTIHVEDHLEPLTVLTLGLSPNMSAQVVTTASAVLMDTRNGYIYGYAEATEKGGQLASGWTTTAAVEAARKRTETRAFGKLVDHLQQTWTGVVRNFAVDAKPAAARQ